MDVGDEVEVRGDGDDAVGEDDATVTVRCDTWARQALVCPTVLHVTQSYRVALKSTFHCFES
jgi:hypothetical protein